MAGSILVLLLSIPAALWVGARLFQVGLLIYGKRPTVREIWAILRGGGKVRGGDTGWAEAQ
ncbi:MAG TPA: hypothetical protein EYH30_08455 [Anaerolineales bacterium]|nr:hypothetical protein [Anaerolineales bacterium]